MKRSIPLILVCFIYLLGCGDSENKPSTKDYEKQFSVEIPAYLELSSFDVEASENVGSKVEPYYKARFKATVKLKTKTFELSNQENDATFIRPVADEGEKKEIYGMAGARLSAGNWKIDFNLENNPIPALGNPKDFFTGGRIIIVGTAEESDFKAQMEQKQLVAQQESEKALKAQQLEQEKQNTERERKRIIDEQERQKATEATRLQQEARAKKLAAEKAAEVEKRKTTLQAKLRNGRGNFIDGDKFVHDGRGAYKPWRGRSKTFIMHPKSQSEIGYIETEYYIPKGGATLVAEYAACPQDPQDPSNKGTDVTDFVGRLVVIDDNDNRHVLTEDVVTSEQGWISKEVPLDEFSDRIIRVRLESACGGSNPWYYEFCAVGTFYVFQ